MEILRYAQIDENGLMVSDSYLSGEVSAENMIPISEDFDLSNKKYDYDNKTWVEYIPPEPEPEPTEQEIIQAETLLNQAEIMAKQNEQDEVLAAILLGQQTV